MRQGRSIRKQAARLGEFPVLIDSRDPVASHERDQVLAGETRIREHDQAIGTLSNHPSKSVIEFARIVRLDEME